MVGTSTAAPTIGDARVRILPDITGFGPLLSRELGQRATILAGALGAGLAAPLALSAGAAISFEDAFAAVRKTVDESPEGFARLEQNIRNLATTMPITAEELSRIGGVAGQLGISGVDNLTKFIDTIARLSVSVDGIDAEEAALRLARFINVTDQNIEQVDILAAGLVDLGNKFAANEGEILRFASLLAGAGKVVGLTQAEIFAFSTALASAGIPAERAGTAISRTIIEIGVAADAGGPKLDTFAKVAGTTAAEFQKLVKTEPAKAVAAFIEGIGKVAKGSPAEAVEVLKDLGLYTERTRDVLLRSSAAIDQFDDALIAANESIAAGTALNIESGRRFETTASQIQILKNTFNELGITVGQQIKPAINFFIDAMRNLLTIIRSIPAPVLTAITVFAGVAGSVLAMGAAFIYTMQFVSKLFAILKLAGGLAGVPALFFKMSTSMFEVGKGAQAASASIAQVRASASFTPKGLGGILSRLTGTGGILAAATIGFFLLSKRIEDVDKRIDGINESADTMASSLGLITTGLKVLEREAAQVGDIEIGLTIKQREENQVLIARLRGLREEFREGLALELVLELVSKGNTPEQAAAAAQAIFDAAGIEMPVEIKADFQDFAEQVAAGLPNVVERIAASVNSLAVNLSSPFTSASADAKQAKDDIAALAKEILILNDVGRSDLAVQALINFQTTVQETIPDVKQQSAVIKLLQQEMARLSGLPELGPDFLGFRDINDNLQGLINTGGSVAQFFKGLRFENGQWIADVDKGKSVLFGQEEAIDGLGDAAEDTAEDLAELTAAEQEAKDAADEARLAFESQRDSLINASPIWGEYAGAVKVNVNDITNSLHEYVRDQNDWAKLSTALVGHVSATTLEALEGLSIGQKAALTGLARDTPAEFSRLLGHYEQAFGVDLPQIAAGGIEDLKGTLADPEIFTTFNSHFLEGFDFNAIEAGLSDKISTIGAGTISRLDEEARQALTGTGDRTSGFGTTGRLAGDQVTEAFSQRIGEGFPIALTSVGSSGPVRNSTRTLGHSMIGGVMLGVRSFPLGFLLGGYVINAINTAKRRAGIESPSRVTRDVIGKPLGEGIALGIRDTIPQSVRAFSDLSSALQADAPELIANMRGVGGKIGSTLPTPTTTVVPVESTDSQPTPGDVYNIDIELADRDPRTASERLLGVLRTTSLLKGHRPS